MTRKGIDYAWHGELDVERFVAAGVTFAIRYVSHTDAKNLHRDEADLLSGAGIDVAVVWETSEKRPLVGYDGGAADAHDAAELAEACGMLNDRPIYFAVDYDAPTSDLPIIARYLEGAASAVGAPRVGVYGGYRVVRYCFDNAVATYGWQTRAWSQGARDPRAHVYQHQNGVVIGGVQCDLNRAYATDFGQWSTEMGDSPAAVPFPYLPTHYLGTARADPKCHWGANATDKASVAQWQARMAERGWNIPSTGFFGSRSDSVCRRFQEAKGLETDGMVGPITWTAAWIEPVT